MEYRARYDPDADVLLLVFSEEGKLDRAEEVGNIVVHYSEDGKILAIEILQASRTVSKLVEALARREVAIPA